MFSNFFIKRPVFASVVSIIIVIAGIMGLTNLAVEEYPDLTPPQITVTAQYPGADAATIAKSVAIPLENAINGVDDMIYMKSTSSADGTLSISVYFKIGTDSMEANIKVNNRVQAIVASLPAEVQRFGVTTSERGANMLEVVSFFTDDDSIDPITLNNYININVIPEIERVDGVGGAIAVGSKEYSLRIWLRPDQLTKYNLTVAEVIAQVREQNSQYAAGKIGSTPMSSDVPYVFNLKASGRLSDIEEFKNIIIKAQNNTNIVRLRDVAKVELGANSYDFQGYRNAKNIMMPVMIFMRNGANAIATVDGVSQKIKELSKTFPAGLKHDVVYDTTQFVKTSIDEVLQTFAEAILLVLIVMYLFLKNIRATIIPMLAVPVSILGTFALLYVLGFSINLITLFALLLSIGLVVDDAIIVIENVERILEENPGMDVKDATRQAMEEVFSPVISIVLVLSAVFIPVSFMSGFTGQIQKEFALTLVSSIFISGFVALSFTPALCGVFLKSNRKEKAFWFVEWFNKIFDVSTNIFTSGVKQVLRHVIPSLIVVGIVFYSCFKLLSIIPNSLVPSEDKGVIMSFSMLPPGTTLRTTSKTILNVNKDVMQIPEVASSGAMIGYDMMSGSLKESAGISFYKLDDWSKRPDENQSSFAIADALNKKYFFNPLSQTFFLNPPAINGMGLSGGFDLYLQSKTGKSYEQMAKDVQKVFAKARMNPVLNPMRLRTNLEINTPQYDINIDKDKLKILGININDIYTTLNATVGEYYINDFNMFGKSYKVKLRSPQEYRSNINDLNSIFVRSKDGKMISLSSLLTFTRNTGAASVERFNLYPSASISGVANAGYTSADAMNAIESEIFSVLSPAEYSIGWSGAAYQEKQTAGTGSKAFIFGLIFVFLILAAQYERWLMPVAIISSIPFAVLGSLIAVYLRDLSNDIYFQIGLLVLIGLSAKNAVLIVEFAMNARSKGKSLIDSAIEASKLRFRPIVMTSIAFILGVLPMALSTGAGAASRHALATGVIGGMIIASTIALFFVPLFFYIFEGLSEWIAKKRGKEIVFNNEKKGA